MRNVYHALHGGFEGLGLYLIDEQRHQNREGKEKHDIAYCQSESVHKKCAELTAVDDEIGKLSKSVKAMLGGLKSDDKAMMAQVAEFMKIIGGSEDGE